MELGKLQGSEPGGTGVQNSMVDVLAFFPLLWIFYQLLILGLGLWDVLHSCWDPAEGFVVMDVSGLMNQIPKCFV